MKQKIVIKVSMKDHKSRSKALKISVGVLGVESAALTGPDKDQVEVVGEGIDAVELTRKLRKNAPCAELVSVGEAKKEKQEAAAKVVAPTQQPPLTWYYPPPPPPYTGYLCHDSAYNYNNDPSCTIM